MIPQMRSRNLSSVAAFPAEDILELRRLGVLLAPLPPVHGGLGWSAATLGAALRLIGSGSLVAGRLFEGHVNALLLICGFGSEAQIAAAARDVHNGHLFGIWNTEGPDGVRLRTDGRLRGRKINVSAAGVATRAVITVDQDRDNRMLVIALQAGERAGPMAGTLHGMRGTGAGWIDLDHFSPDPAGWIGEPHDYLRQPDFSAGAWRTLAVLVGGLDYLVEELCCQLRQRGRDAAPHQRARIAQALIARDTASLWVQHCASMVDDRSADTARLVATVNLARSAVERACFDAIALVQQSLGLMALVEGNPVENLTRDLTTYLRQPALDEALDEAAATFVNQDIPKTIREAAA
jgi:alkylation response protein AidB-like acyl-CoA dehydrogenase